jgi:hypothetical protein
LIEHRDFSIGSRRQNVFGVDMDLGLIAWHEAHGPRKVPRVSKFRGARGDEDLRDLVVIQIFANRGIACCPKAAEDEGDLLLFDEKAAAFLSAR